jgi:hypothetical protein
MTFKELLSQSHWLDVQAELTRLFPAYVEYTDSYRLAYDELRRLKPDDGNIRLFIGRYDPHGIIPFYVLGFDGDCPKGVCLKFSPWEKWLGVNVDGSLLIQYEQTEVIAICLYDMTWAGFSSEDVGIFRSEYINHENCLWSVFGFAEDIEASESNLVKQKQRSDEFYEALGLHDFDTIPFGKESPEYHKARLDMEVKVYCLGESETDYEVYCSKVSALREDFLLKWPEPGTLFPHVH